MPKRINPEPSWGVNAHTEIRVSSMPEDVRSSFNQLVGEIIDHGRENGTISFVSAGGYSNWSGLDKHLDGIMRDKVVRECPKSGGCFMELDLVGTAQGNDEIATIDISCPNLSYPTRQEAREAEAKCKLAHGETIERFQEWALGTIASVRDFKEQIESAQRTERAAASMLDQLL